MKIPSGLTSLTLCLLLGLISSSPARAFEFRTISEDVSVLYDAPSAKSKKLYIITRDYPVEVIVPVEGWSKIREASGKLAWIETKYLSEKRTVLINVDVADIRVSPDTGSAIAFQAQKNVILDLLEFSTPGWVKVHHRDGQVGFIRAEQIWGV